MNTLRDAAQQALEFLRTRRLGAEAHITALEAALAEPQPQPEPVAWASKHALDRIKDFDGTIYANGGFDDAVPLYTAQPQRQPLSDEQIKAAVMDDPFFWAALMSMMRDGVMVAQVRDVIAGVFRAAEKAHGIGGAT